MNLLERVKKIQDKQSVKEYCSWHIPNNGEEISCELVERGMESFMSQNGAVFVDEINKIGKPNTK